MTSARAPCAQLRSYLDIKALAPMAGSITPYDTAQGRPYRVRYRQPDKSQNDKREFRTKKEGELFLAP